MQMPRFYLIFFLLILSCNSTDKMNTSSPGNPLNEIGFDWQGHRGCRGLMPENTIAAMLKALDLGVATLEMDVVITKDKQVILSHEPFFNHEITTKPDRSFVTEAEEKQLNIYQMYYDEVVKYDVGLKPHPRFLQQQKIAVIKPRLVDVIDSVEAYSKLKQIKLPLYNVETKSQPSTDNAYHPAPAEFVDLLMGVIKEKKIRDRTIIQSFDIRTLQYLHKNYPEIKTALLVETPGKRSLQIKLNELGFKPTIYSPNYLLVTKKVVAYCKQAGIKIIPWTVNELSAIKRLKAMGVDGIITDYPNLLMK